VFLDLVINKRKKQNGNKKKCKREKERKHPTIIEKVVCWF